MEPKIVASPGFTLPTLNTTRKEARIAPIEACGRSATRGGGEGERRTGRLAAVARRPTRRGRAGRGARPSGHEGRGGEGVQGEALGLF